MTQARTEILQHLRKNNPGTARQPVVDQLARHPRGPQPAWETTTEQRFIEKVQAAAGTLQHIPSGGNIVDAITGFLQSNALPQSLVLANHPLLNAIDWPHEITHATRVAHAKDQCSVTVAFAGIAETGSLVMLSGPDTPTSLNFLPDNFIAILKRERIFPHIEDAWDLIRKECNAMPRAINLVTGPSRTADVEQKIQLGAHGPRRLHILMLE